MEVVLILTVTAIVAAATEMSIVNVAVGAAIAGATMMTVVVAIITTAEIVVMNVLTIMTAAVEMISVRSLALSQDHFLLTKAMCVAAKNLKPITMIGSKISN